MFEFFRENVRKLKASFKYHWQFSRITVRLEVCGNNYLFAFHLFLGIFLIKKNEEYNTEIEKKNISYSLGIQRGGEGDFNLKKNLDRYIIKLNHAFIWIPSWYQRNSWQAN